MIGGQGPGPPVSYGAIGTVESEKAKKAVSTAPVIPDKTSAGTRPDKDLERRKKKTRTAAAIGRARRIRIMGGMDAPRCGQPDCASVLPNELAVHKRKDLLRRNRRGIGQRLSRFALENGHDEGPGLDRESFDIDPVPQERGVDNVSSAGLIENASEISISAASARVHEEDGRGVGVAIPVEIAGGGHVVDPDSQGCGRTGRGGSFEDAIGEEDGSGRR
jgi:hypothetical protein